MKVKAAKLIGMVIELIGLREEIPEKHIEAMREGVEEELEDILEEEAEK